MQRAVVLLILSLISVAFLLIQVTVLRRLENNGKDGLHLLPSWLKQWSFKKTDNLFLILIKEFNETCLKNNVTLFIIDRQILKNILQPELTQSSNELVKSCRYLCQRKTISLGVLASDWNDVVLEDLQQRNIKFTEITGQDPRLVTIQSTTRQFIPLHIILSHGQYILHISLFYERGHLGLWHGSISKQDLFLQSFVHGGKNEEILPVDEHFQNEGILDRFSLETVKVDGVFLAVPAEIDVFLKTLATSTFLPCNFKRARAFYTEYGEDNSHEAKQFRRRGRDVLQITKKNLDMLGVRFWLSSGTCLGWFRQCNIISHSQDMDIGIWIKDYSKQLIQKFHEDGLYLHHILGKVEDSYQMSFRTIDNVRLDIFFFYEEGTYMWNGGTRAKTGAKFKYLFPNFSLCWAEYLEMKVRVPCDTLSYVEANYGKLWSSQIKQWDWKSSPSNVIENGRWNEKELSEVVQFFELQ